MDTKKLRKKFTQWLKVADADYAIIYPDEYGDCMTCVNAELADIYGDNSTGVFVKHWQYGMNADGRLEDAERAYICHDITPEQADVFISLLAEDFIISPTEYDPTKCFMIEER